MSVEKLLTDMVVYYSINEFDVVYLLYALRRRKMTFLNTSLTAWGFVGSDPDSTYFIMSVWPVKKPCTATAVGVYPGILMIEYVKV
jgi:hypothetical protein